MNLKERYLELLEETTKRADPIGRVTQRDGVIRSALQVAALTALEVTAAMHHRETLASNETLQQHTQKLFHEHARDSLPIALLRGCTKVLEPHLPARTLEDLRQAIKLANDQWLVDRNNRAHGSGAEQEAHKGLAVLPDADVRRILEKLSSLYPNFGPNGKKTVNLGGVSFQLDSVPIRDGQPGVVGARFRLSERGWILPCKKCNDSAEFECIIPHDAPLTLFKEEPEPGIAAQGNTYYLLPKPPSTFHGRTKQLERLAAWLNDKDNRTAIMLSGTGGIGKTALAIEFFYRQLRHAPEALPTFIVFHTAKKTRWGIHGLVAIPRISDSLDDAIRTVLITIGRALATPLPFKLNEFAGSALLSRATKMTRDWGLKRDEILLIIDNAETLEERDELGPILNNISGQFARLMITSRDSRYQDVDLRDIAIPPLSENETIDLIRELAKRRGGQPLRDAGQTSLKNLAIKLRGHPLLIHAYVEVLAQKQLGMSNAADELNRLGERDLAQFLYETAWTPLSEGAQLVLFGLTRFGGAGRREHVGALCAALNLPFVDVEEELNATYIVRINENGRDFLIEQLALDWLEQKFTALDDATKALVDDARRKAACTLHIANDSFMASLSEHERRAYWLSTAEAAAIAWHRKDRDSARNGFEKALQLDPNNGALFERYGALLLELDDFTRAMHHCDRAEALGASMAYVEYTRARIHAQMKQYFSAHEALGRSERSGHSADEVGRFRVQLIADELQFAVSESSKRRPHSQDQVLMAIRQRAEGYLDALLPDPPDTLRRRDNGELLPKTSIANRAKNYQIAGADGELRRAAKAFCDLDKQLIDMARRNQ